MAHEGIEQRKSDHIEVAASGRADFRKRTTLLECVELTHQSLPEMAVDDIDLSTELCGKTLRAPIVVTGMTGGTAEAREINRDLARAADKLGLAFGVGSQRAMAEKPELLETYQVRDVAPDLLLIGNLGVVQASEYGVDRIRKLVDDIGADALAIHLNPAQEMIQAHGDRDFRGGLKVISELVERLERPIIVKETGCGLSLQSARRLAEVGVTTVDVSGAGGTSWVAVERHRASEGSVEESLGDELWDWGLPTALSTALCARAGLTITASGGIRSGHDICRAIALGASAGGMAAPLLRAQLEGGYEGVRAALEALIRSIRTIHLLAGAASIAELRAAPHHLRNPLRDWLRDLES